MDVVLILRAGFVLASLLIIAIFITGPLACRFLSYGPRSVPHQAASQPGRQSSDASSAQLESTGTPALDKLLDHLATYRISRSWFGQFYPYTVAASCFWFYQIVTRGPWFQYIAYHTSPSVSEGMSTDQVLIVWILFTFQGCRRLMETLLFSKPTTSTLWILHWVVGVGFYTAMNIAVWVEGIPSLINDPIQTRTVADVLKVTRVNIIPVALLLFATQVQFFAHKHLASLPSAPNYQIPTDRLFARNLTPHYFAEYLIYVALASMAAPPGYLVNVTIACGAVFVLVNLGVTAHVTRVWYARRFGEEKINMKWRMIPKIW